MFDILSITTPIYLTIAVGYAATRFGLFDKSGTRFLGSFVLNVALPCMLFNALIQRRFAEIFNPAYLFAYAAGSLLMLTLGLLWARQAEAEPTARPYIAMGMTCSNSGFVGFPILLLTLPTVAGVAFALNMLVENVLIIPILLSLMEQRQAPASNRLAAIGRALLNLRKNPLVVAIVAAFVFSWLSLKLPKSAEQTLTFFAQASTAVSLFAIGSSLYRLPVEGMAKRVVPITVGKLLLHPCAIWLALGLAGLIGLPTLDRELRNAILITGALPIMGVYPLFGMRQGHEGFCAAALLSTTVCSFVTLSLFLHFLIA